VAISGEPMLLRTMRNEVAEAVRVDASDGDCMVTRGDAGPLQANGIPA
jgi:hypothetical protein